MYIVAAKGGGPRDVILLQLIESGECRRQLLWGNYEARTLETTAAANKRSLISTYPTIVNLEYPSKSIEWNPVVRECAGPALSLLNNCVLRCQWPSSILERVPMRNSPLTRCEVELIWWSKRE